VHVCVRACLLASLCVTILLSCNNTAGYVTSTSSVLNRHMGHITEVDHYWLGPDVGDAKWVQG